MCGDDLLRRETLTNFIPTEQQGPGGRPGPWLTSWGGDGPPVSFGIARGQRDHGGARVDHGDLDSTVQLSALLRTVGANGIRADHLHHLDPTGIDAGGDQRIADRSRPALAKAVSKRVILADLDVGLQHESLIRVPSRPRGHELDLLPALRTNVCGS